MAFGLCFPDAHPSMQELCTIGFADQLTLQKEVNHRYITPIEVDVNFPTPQPIEEPRTRVAATEEGEFPVADRIAPSGRIFPVHGFHEQELQIILRSHPAGNAFLANAVFPEGNAGLSPQLVPFLHVSIDNCLNEELL